MYVATPKLLFVELIAAMAADAQVDVTEIVPDEQPVIKNDANNQPAATCEIDLEVDNNLPVNEDDANNQSAAVNEKPDPQSESLTDHLPIYLRVIKRIALALIASCICVGAVMSKVSLVSITDRMNPRFNFSTFPDEHSIPNRSALFIQLTLLLVIPEVVSFIRCLVWGVIGKTTKSFPWPSQSAFIWVSRSIASYSHPSKNRLVRNTCAGLANIFLARLARYCIKSCTYLASLALKIKQLFLQTLQENYLTIYCKVFISCKKSFIFSARHARYVQPSKNCLAKISKSCKYFSCNKMKLFL